MNLSIHQPADLFAKLTEISHLAVDIEPLYHVVLQEICQTIHWDYGEIWTMSIEQHALCLSSSWYLSQQIHELHRLSSWQQFRACSLDFTLHLGEGLPGRVWLSQQPEWVADVSTQSEGYFLRNQIAKAFSVKAGLGVPILVNRRVKAVCVFFKARSCQTDPAIMGWIQTVIQQLEQAFTALDL